jgi:hypothetical protein
MVRIHPPPRHTQKVRQSLLDIEAGPPLFRHGPVAVLRPPPNTSHLDYANELLADAGFSSVAGLRALPNLPTARWMVRVLAHPPPDFAEACNPLWCAAVLGFAGPSFYSTNRPAVWTPDRLSRAITLHRVASFYAS